MKECKYKRIRATVTCMFYEKNCYIFLKVSLWTSYCNNIVFIFPLNPSFEHYCIMQVKFHCQILITKQVRPIKASKGEEEGKISD